MKKIQTAAAMAAAFGFAMLASQAAFAADGTITFNGQVTAATCTITGAGAATGTDNITVQMPTVSASSLNAANSVAGDTPFQLVLGGGANCTNGKTAALWIETSATPDLDVATNNLKNHAAGGSSAEVHLINPANNNQVLLNVNNPVVNGSTVVVGSNQPAATIAGNTATLKYIAQYQNAGAAGSVTPGLVQSVMTYSMQYN